MCRARRGQPRVCWHFPLLRQTSQRRAFLYPKASHRRGRWTERRDVRAILGQLLRAAFIVVLATGVASLSAPSALALTVNVKESGAIGDGVADDTAALQRAL